MSCEVCNISQGIIRCKTCIGYHRWCKPCAVKVHKYLPFHWLEVWEGTKGFCYKDTSLCKLGFVWFLGHGGELCPSSDNWQDEAD
ncbi:hypothetical protein PAXRUDRAFT_52087, partial [Paxillus rubicundulus Ve08.2h10]